MYYSGEASNTEGFGLLVCDQVQHSEQGHQESFSNSSSLLEGFVAGPCGSVCWLPGAVSLNPV